MDTEIKSSKTLFTRADRRRDIFFAKVAVCHCGTPLIPVNDIDWLCPVPSCGPLYGSRDLCTKLASHVVFRSKSLEVVADRLSANHSNSKSLQEMAAREIISNAVASYHRKAMKIDLASRKEMIDLFLEVDPNEEKLKQRLAKKNLKKVSKAKV